MYALNTRLTVGDWDYIARQAYETYAQISDRQTLSWTILSDREQQAWTEAIVRAVTVAIGELPKPEHVITGLDTKAEDGDNEKVP